MTFPGIRFSRPAAYFPLTASGIWGDERAGGARFHQGIDIVMPKRTPVLAMAPGTVAYARLSSDPTGNIVVITHAGGWTSRYMHLDSRAVKTGETVERGQVIGYVGSTGGSGVNHLHLSVLLDKARLAEFERAYGKPTTGWGTVWDRGTAVPAEPMVPLDQYRTSSLDRMKRRGVLSYQEPPQINTAKWFALSSIALAVGVGAFIYVEGRR